MMHFCYSQIRSEIAHVDEFQHAQHESPVYDRRELTIKTCLHFRPVAVILNWVYLMFFWILKIIAVFLLAQLPSLHSGVHSFLPDQNLTSESDQSSVDCCKMPSLQLLNCWTCLIIKRWKYNPHERRCSSGWSVCVCVCVCVCARVCACVCACAVRSKTDKQSSLHFELRARPNDKIHTQYVKTDGLESIHLKQFIS